MRKSPWYIIKVLPEGGGTILKDKNGKVKFFSSVGFAEAHANYMGISAYIIKHWNFPKNFYEYHGGGVK